MSHNHDVTISGSTVGPNASEHDWSIVRLLISAGTYGVQIRDSVVTEAVGLTTVRQTFSTTLLDDNLNAHSRDGVLYVNTTVHRDNETVTQLLIYQPRSGQMMEVQIGRLLGKTIRGIHYNPTRFIELQMVYYRFLNTLMPYALRAIAYR